MAIQDKTMTAAEHDWYATRSGVVAYAPLNDHKRAYYIARGVSDANGKKISQMEKEWLAKQTGVTSKYIPDMWVEAVAGAGKTPGGSVTANKFVFYTQVAGNP